MRHKDQLQGVVVAVPPEGRPGRIQQVYSVPVSGRAVITRRWEGYRLTGLEERENLVTEVSIFMKAPLPYEIYCMLCLPL